MNKIEQKIKYWEAQKEGYHESNIKYTNICMFIDDLKELSVNLVSKDKVIKMFDDDLAKFKKQIDTDKHEGEPFTDSELECWYDNYERTFKKFKKQLGVNR